MQGIMELVYSETLKTSWFISLVGFWVAASIGAKFEGRDKK